jgi:toxin ParE1/3/4
VVSRRLEILKPAAEEAIEAARWYYERNVKAAEAFQREVRAAFDRIRESPDIWPVHHHDTRRVLLERFPYEIVYRILADAFLIVAVAHCRRRPGYWRGR